MNYLQKALALKALGDFEIRLRDTGEWYALAAGEIKSSRMLKSMMGNGSTPEAAVEDLWKQATTLPSDEYIVLCSYTDRRSAVRWNGFMWQLVIEKSEAA